MEWIKADEQLPTTRNLYWVVLKNPNYSYDHYEVDQWHWDTEKQDWYLYDQYDGYYFLSEPQPYCDARFYVGCVVTHWMEKFKPTLPEELS